MSFLFVLNIGDVENATLNGPPFNSAADHTNVLVFTKQKRKETKTIMTTLEATEFEEIDNKFKLLSVSF